MESKANTGIFASIEEFFHCRREDRRYIYEWHLSHSGEVREP